jgi:hypothetical protein
MRDIMPFCDAISRIKESGKSMWLLFSLLRGKTND